MDQKAKCIVCGKEYSVCRSCKDVKEYRPWRTVCDTIECYKLFLVVSGYNNGQIVKNDARKQLAKIKYDIDDLGDGMQKIIKDILAEQKKSAADSGKNTDK